MSSKPDIEIASKIPPGNLSERRIRLLIDAILEGEDIKSGRIDLLFSDNDHIAELHSRHLGKAGPTDVLSFSLEDAPGVVEGDIIISVEMAETQAPEFGTSTEAELMRYVAHGVLHLLGYDDSTDHLQTAMRQREDHYLRRAEARFGGGCGVESNIGV